MENKKVHELINDVSEYLNVSGALCDTSGSCAFCGCPPNLHDPDNCKFEEARSKLFRSMYKMVNDLSAEEEKGKPELEEPYDYGNLNEYFVGENVPYEAFEMITKALDYQAQKIKALRKMIEDE